jgi:hypothetical protein
MYQKSRFAIYTGIFAVFYTFCFYKNLEGVTFSLFVIGALVYISLCLKEFSVARKKDTTFFAIVAALIGLSHPLTDNGFVHTFNFIFGFAILIYIVMHQFANDERWTFFTTVENFFKTICGAVGKIDAPFRDVALYKKAKKENTVEPTVKDKRKKKVDMIVITIAAILPALMFVTLILSSADMIFANMLNTIFYGLFNWPIELTFYFKIAFFTIAVFLLAYGLFSYLKKKPFSEEIKEVKTHDATVAITAGIMFDAIYLTFSMIQILYLFIGKLSLPNNVSYAEYARKGFFQVLFVCVLNLVIVLIGKTRFKENRLLKIVLTVMCACTYIMIASSALRLVMYIRYYYFSFLRMLAFWALTVVFILLTGILIHVWTDKVNLFKFSLRVILVAYTVLSLSHIDYFVAELNMSQTRNNSDFFISKNYDDYEYVLRSTCLDAAPVIEKYDFDNKTYYYNRNDIDNEITFRNFNLSRYIAKKNMK